MCSFFFNYFSCRIGELAFRIGWNIRSHLDSVCWNKSCGTHGIRNGKQNKMKRARESPIPKHGIVKCANAFRYKISKKFFFVRWIFGCNVLTFANSKHAHCTFIPLYDRRTHCNGTAIMVNILIERIPETIRYLNTIRTEISHGRCFLLMADEHKLCISRFTSNTWLFYVHSFTFHSWFF